MILLNGKYNSAKVFNDNIDDETTKQIIDMCSQPFVEGKKIRIMPDTHAGAGCTIGTTMEIKDFIVPNWVGVDIGCGMTFCKIPKDIADTLDYGAVDHIIRTLIPSGMAVHEHEAEDKWLDELSNLHCFNSVNISRAKMSLGTLGGGNHFIEISRSEETGDVYLIVHSGSRNLGKQIAEYYQKLADNTALRLSSQDSDELEKMVERMKNNGEQRLIGAAIEDFNKKHKRRYQKGMAPLTGEQAQMYLNDVNIAKEFAFRNRHLIIKTILNALGVNTDGWTNQNSLTDSVILDTVHNYVEVTKTTDGSLVGMLRKGAISAKKDEIVLIPLNMRDGSLLCVGKGNEDWNESAPHGAGRLFSRSAAKEAFSLNDFIEALKGVYSTSVCEATIDESPMAYKDASSIEAYISETVDIVQHLKPLYNFKATG